MYIKGLVCLMFILSSKSVQAQTTKQTPTIRILSVQGQVTANGKPITELGELPSDTRVETTNGTVTIAVGLNNVMKLGQSTSLRVVAGASGEVATFLESGRVEGVRKIENVNGIGATVVGTSKGLECAPKVGQPKLLRV